MRKFLAQVLVAALFAAVLITAPVSVDPIAAQDAVPVTPVNVALDGVVSQSTTAFGGAAGRAIDDNTSGIYNQRSVTHTEVRDPSPWWQIELAEPTNIDNIVLWNRTDSCCTSRLANFTVFVSATPFANNATIAQLENDPNITAIGFNGVASATESFQPNTVGQYVRIQQPAGNPLSLAEVQIFGTPNTGNGGGDPDGGDGPVDIDFNNDPVEVVFPTVDPIIPVAVDNPPIFNDPVPAPRPAEELPDVCSAQGQLAISVPTIDDTTVEAAVTLPPGARLFGDVETVKENSFSGNWGGRIRGVSLEPTPNSSGSFSFLNTFFSGPSTADVDSGRIATNSTSEPVSFRITMTIEVQVSVEPEARGFSALQNLRFVDADGNETQVCEDEELIRCLANGGNFFSSDSITIRGVIYLGCLLFDSPWIDAGLTLQAVETLFTEGVIQVAEGVTASDIFVTFNTVLSTLGQVTLGCVNAFGDLIGSVQDILLAVIELVDDPDAFLSEQYTLIRDTVNAAVQDPNNFVDQALAGFIQLELLQENAARWVGTVGCELLIEVLLAFTGAGAAAVAARVSDRVIDFLQSRRLDLDGRPPRGDLDVVDPQGVLSPAGENLFMSEAGLAYGPDPSSNFVNRLDHIRNHGIDRPDRTVHGVFDGDPLAVTHEAWRGVLAGDAVSVQQGSRVAHYFRFDRDIGFIGGENGAASGFPGVNTVVIVVENGNRIVTAFPTSGIPIGAS